MEATVELQGVVEKRGGPMHAFSTPWKKEHHLPAGQLHHQKSRRTVKAIRDREEWGGLLPKSGGEGGLPAGYK
jgi:hypothetical protein